MEPRRHNATKEEKKEGEGFGGQRPARGWGLLSAIDPGCGKLLDCRGSPIGSGGSGDQPRPARERECKDANRGDSIV